MAPSLSLTRSHACRRRVCPALVLTFLQIVRVVGFGPSVLQNHRISSSTATQRWSSKTPNDEVMNAAARLTQDRCSLLGVKSVGVDYGLVRTGVAVTVGYNPEPLKTLYDLNTTEACDEIVEIARWQQASRVIVGLPWHKNGTVAEQTNLTFIFADHLAQAVARKLGPEIKVELFDERYTSKEAAARMRSAKPRDSVYGMLDDESACIILQNYYSENGVGSIPVELSPESREECRQAFKLAQAAEEQQQQQTIEERELRIQQRKDAIARDNQLQAELGLTSKKKKKKKRKKKR